MAPIVHGLESEFYNQMNFVYLDIDDSANSDLLNALGFRYQPHFFLIDGEGNIIEQWLGPVQEQEFRNSFEENL
jgi:thioredoxin-related protein